MIAPFHADAPAGAAGLGRAGVAGEDDFRVEIEDEKRDRRIQAFDGKRPRTDLRAFRAHEQRHALLRRAGKRINGDGGAARVVAVEAEAGVEEIPGVYEGSEHKAELGTGKEGRDIARVGRRVAVDRG